jgi:hypothetical protein
VPAGSRRSRRRVRVPAPERERAGAGARRGASRGAPAVRRVGGRGLPTGTSSTSRASSSSIAPRLPRGPGPGPPERPRACCRGSAPVGQVDPVRDPGDGVRPGRVPEGPVDHLDDGSGRPGRQCRTRLRPPGGSARCQRQSAGGRGEIRRAEKSAGGRRCTVGGEPGGGRVRPSGYGVVRRPRDGPDRPGEEGDRSRRARVERRTASSGRCRGRASCGRTRGRRAQERRGGPCGNELLSEPGDLDRRAGRGDPLTGQATGSPRARTSPVAAGESRAGDGHPVAPVRSRRPRGLMPGTGTARGATGRAPCGSADDAGPRGSSAATGEDAAGWIVGVLGSSCRTTGRSASGRLSRGRGGDPQARYSPC